QVHGAVHVILVAEHAKRPELRIDGPLGDSLDQAILLETVANEIGDRADLEPVLPREFLEIGPPRHAAVFIQDLDDDRRRLEPRESRQIATGFRVARAREHAAWLRHQRKDMTRLPQILGPSVPTHGCTYRLRAI